MTTRLARRDLRTVPEDSPQADDCRRYGPREMAHPFHVHEMVLYHGEGEARRLVKIFRACPGGWKQVEP